MRTRIRGAAVGDRFITFYFSARTEIELFKKIDHARRMRGLSWKSYFLQALAYLEPQLIDDIMGARLRAGKGMQKQREKWENETDE